MPMYGYDISNHQSGLNIDSLINETDFLIFKATEGMTFDDPYFRGWANRCVQKGHPFGFYHYAKSNDPVKECDHFLAATEDYHLAGIPVLDWEEKQSVDWVNRFVGHYHAVTGVWPWIYANPWRFNQGGVNTNCARWAAAYQKNPPKCDIPIAAWQFSSTPLDKNVFYGDSGAWKAYATGRGGERMTDEQARQLAEVHAEIMREDDPTGRGMEMRDHPHIKWIAAVTQETLQAVRDLTDTVKALQNTIEGKGADVDAE